jgi:DNA replicative helicase MCM subunit Mcm2 (Cdc46/Mcm family)
MRELNSNRVSQLVQISGIITSASKPKVRSQQSGVFVGGSVPLNAWVLPAAASSACETV